MSGASVVCVLGMLASAAAFQTPAAAPTLRSPRGGVALRGSPIPPPTAPVRARPAAAVLRMAAIKESPLDHAGDRAIEEEERRISMWKAKFDLSDEQVGALRKSFEQVLDTVQTDTRAVPTQAMKRVIETTQVLVDSVDVGNDGRPAVTHDELQNYVAALGPLWAETCENDAVEVANGECLVPLDTENFDLSECMAVFGMCLREHCGIGGVCFWDTPSTPQESKQW